MDAMASSTVGKKHFFGTILKNSAASKKSRTLAEKGASAKRDNIYCLPRSEGFMLAVGL